MTNLRNLVALSVFVVVGGTLYNVFLGAPINNVKILSDQHSGSVTLSEPVIIITQPAIAASIEEPQELVSVQEKQETQPEEPHYREPEAKEASDNFSVPFYSQFADINDPAWKKIGCGIASLAMLIDYYEPAVSVDALLAEGIATNAYLTDAGWTYAGLIGVAKKHGLTGESIVMSDASMDDAYEALEKSLEEGPVIASVYYTFTPGHPIPHLVVVNGIEDGVVHYNDPAESEGDGTISIERFKSAWKKRYITLRLATS